MTMIRPNVKKYRILEKRILKYRMSKLNIKHISTQEGWGKFFNTLPTKLDSLHNSKLYPTYTCKEWLEAFSKPQ